MEVNLLGRLKHPNILRILGYHREGDNLYLMLEFAENGSLLKLVKEVNYLPEHLVASYVEQVLKALVYLHASGVIHRDLKVCLLVVVFCPFFPPVFHTFSPGCEYSPHKEWRCETR